MDLFAPCTPEARWHPIFRQLMQPENAPERMVLQSWAQGMLDRDGKFVHEFQTSFESSFWELYVHAALREFGMTMNFAFDAPDFVVTAPIALGVEATIAAPPMDGAPASGQGLPDVPEDLNAYNAAAMLRLCNSLDAKRRRYVERYRSLPHVAEQPFVIALAPYDRPLPHLATNRPIVGALYGHYVDEEATLAAQAAGVVQYGIEAVAKSATAHIPVGLFFRPEYADVSAVLFSPLATWGKLRALADKPDLRAVFTTFHPPLTGLMPQVRTTPKHDYREHLLDGLYVFHNPNARRPLSPRVFDHPRVCQFVADGQGNVYAHGPDDFLLLRSVMTVIDSDAIGG